jgi:methionyl aminopeptidase
MPRDADDHLVPGRISGRRTVPASIPRPEYVGRAEPAEHQGDDRYSPDELERIRRASRIAAQALAAMGAAVRPGITRPL